MDANLKLAIYKQEKGKFIVRVAEQASFYPFWLVTYNSVAAKLEDSQTDITEINYLDPSDDRPDLREVSTSFIITAVTNFMSGDVI
jgi:hypothetical protein